MLPNRTTTFVRIEGRYFFFLFWAASLLSLFSIVRTHKNIDTFPYHADYEIHNSDPGIDEGLWREKAAQYIFLVVVDNLTESDIAAMPRFTELRKKAALFSLKAPFPSLSLPAYTTLLTGAPPTITGISSDDNETIDARIDSLPRRLKAAGWKTAVVGSTVWLNYFENDFDLGAVDSFYNRKSKFFKERNSTNAGESKGRSVLWHGVYQPTPDGWRRFIQRYNIAYNFGDDVATAEVEDTSRTRKAIALWKKEGVDFVLLHLQTPPHSALAELDLNFQRVADAVKLQTSILAVVPAHGAKKMLWGTYHGGDEKTVRRVPLTLMGPAIKPGVYGNASLNDVVPTLAALAGVAYPGHNTGKILTQALALPSEKINPAKFRWRQQQKHLERERKKSETRFVDALASQEKLRAFSAALLIVFTLFFLLKSPLFLYATAFFAFECAVGYALYYFLFRTTHLASPLLSGIYSGYLFLLHATIGGFIAYAARRLKMQEVLLPITAFSIVAASIFMAIIPWYSWIHFPAPFVLLAALFFQTQTVAIVLVSLYGWRKKSRVCAPTR